MCLSAEVSFAASIFLVAGGTFATWKATQTNMRYLPVALMPLFAGIQQFMEGNVWIGMNGGDPYGFHLFHLVYVAHLDSHFHLRAGAT